MALHSTRRYVDGEDDGDPLRLRTRAGSCLSTEEPQVRRQMCPVVGGRPGAGSVMRGRRHAGSNARHRRSLVTLHVRIHRDRTPDGCPIGKRLLNRSHRSSSRNVGHLSKRILYRTAHRAPRVSPKPQSQNRVSYRAPCAVPPRTPHRRAAQNPATRRVGSVRLIARWLLRGSRWCLPGPEPRSG